MAALAFADKFAAENTKLDPAPPLPKTLPLVEVKLTDWPVIVAAVLACVIEFAAVKSKVAPAADALCIVTVPGAESEMRTF